MNRFILKRLSKNMQSHFHLIDPNTIKVKEEISDDRVMERDLKDIIEINEDSSYYIYGKEGNEVQKNEKSFPDLARLKNNPSKNKRADLCILEMNAQTKNLKAHVIELKATLDLDNYIKARSQLLNSLIDLELIALIALNSSFNIDSKFYIIYERLNEGTFERFEKNSSFSLTRRLQRNEAKVQDINIVAVKEYKYNQIISDLEIDNHQDRELYRNMEELQCKTIPVEKIRI